MLDNIDERRALGRKVIREMFGEEWAEAYEAQMSEGGFGSECGEMALEFAFAETFGDPRLDRRSRSLVLIGALIAMGCGPGLVNHFRAGLTNGIKVEELELIIMQTIPYVGYVRTSTALEAAAEVLRGQGMSIKTARDRGTI